jgi:hypothetical protein
MINLTPTQQQDLTTFKETGELGILSNLLIEHCLEELKNNEEARNKFNFKRSLYNTRYLEFTRYYGTNNRLSKFGFAINSVELITYDHLHIDSQIIVIQTLLSTTPDGAVMSFLDVPVKEIQKVVITTYHRDKLHANYEYNIGRFATLDALTVCNVTPTTLRQQLSQKYHNLITEQSKTPYQALLEITKDYINHFYV